MTINPSEDQLVPLRSMEELQQKADQFKALCESNKPKPLKDLKQQNKEYSDSHFHCVCFLEKSKGKKSLLERFSDFLIGVKNG